MAKIKTALISVSDKTGIVEFARFLSQQHITLLSTGGTAKALRDAKLKVTDVSEHTGFPEIMDGRVKTLHPKIHGGLLGLRGNKEHVSVMASHGIAPIDLLVVNLYPFESTVESGADFETCIENIDIGGPSMIRSAAKNYRDVLVVTDPADYSALQDAIAKGEVPDAMRKSLAAKAFLRTASYDNAITQWLSERKTSLRYGENPHQAAQLISDGDSKVPGIGNARQLQGKELSYNNIADADAALELVNEFDAPAVAIIKHANPCGVAMGADLSQAYDKALACDPVSAYGSIIAVNKPLDLATAEKISSLFVEVIVAPAIKADAQNLLTEKKNLRLLITGGMPDRNRKSMMVKSISGGVLMQERDYASLKKSQLQTVSKRAPSAAEIEEMLFAFSVCKHVKSNAIVITKSGTTVGIGAGQMSRVDSVRIAVEKATALLNGNLKGCAVASDAFFPFADGLELAAQAGVSCAIQPGGSKRDDEVIAAADKAGMAMVFTDQRHFKH